MKQFFGKYRGKVANNVDPQFQGRIQVICPDVFGDGRLSWAMPSVPYAGDGVGLFLIPPANANVWVEFEAGNLDKVIWAGCFWEAGQVPAQPAVATMKVLKTDGMTLTINDLQGARGVTLEVTPTGVAPLRITLNASGIELSNGAASVKLTTASVSLNNGALEVI